MYYPTRTLYYPPEKFGVPAQEVHFQSKAGPKLFGWFFESKKKPAKATVVFYHGNGENMSSHYISALWLIEKGYNLFVFDYQGYGRSEGDPYPEGTVKDGEAALEWVHQKSPLPMIVLAQSLGGAIALRNVIDQKEKYPIKLLAVDSTFASYKKVGRYILKRSWITWPFQWLAWIVLSDSYAPDGEISKISPIPLLVIHGDKDGLVDYELGQEVFAQAKEPKEFWQVPGGLHTDVFMRQDISWRNRFVEKIESVLK